MRRGSFFESLVHVSREAHILLREFIKLFGKGRAAQAEEIYLVLLDEGVVIHTAHTLYDLSQDREICRVQLHAGAGREGKRNIFDKRNGLREIKTLRGVPPLPLMVVRDARGVAQQLKQGDAVPCSRKFRQILRRPLLYIQSSPFVQLHQGHRRECLRDRPGGPHRVYRGEAALLRR